MTVAETELDRIRRTYTNRSTVPRELLDVVLAWAKAHTAELEALHTGRQDVLRSTIASQAETIESQRTRISMLQHQVDARRSLNEARSAAKDGEVEVTIRRDDLLRAWRLSDLEEIAFRLRCGGATDDTAVDMASNRAIAIVPDANMVTLEHRPKPAPLHLERPEYDRAGPPKWLVAANAFLGSPLTVLALLVCTIAIVVGAVIL